LDLKKFGFSTQERQDEVPQQALMISRDPLLLIVAQDPCSLMAVHALAALPWQYSRTAPKKKTKKAMHQCHLVKAIAYHKQSLQHTLIDKSAAILCPSMNQSSSD